MLVKVEVKTLKLFGASLVNWLILKDEKLNLVVRCSSVQKYLESQLLLIHCLIKCIYEDIYTAASKNNVTYVCHHLISILLSTFCSFHNIYFSAQTLFKKLT